jgi:Ca2+-binding RTX toxin-like protein
MDDLVSLGGAIAATFEGGDGNDTIEGGGGRDDLVGGAGNDVLLGGGNNDLLDGGPGADSFDGGSGRDRATYADRVNPVMVTIDGIANDGESGEGDHVRDSVETITGGFADDTLIGGETFSRLEGGPGNDSLIAGQDTSSILGGPGNDTINTGATDDGFVFVSGEEGNDHLTGSPFPDFFLRGEGATPPSGAGAPTSSRGAGAPTSFGERVARTF